MEPEPEEPRPGGITGAPAEVAHAALKAATDRAWEGLQARFEERRGLLREQDTKLTERKRELLRRQAELKERHGGTGLDDEDIIELNVAGELLRGTRRMFTQLPGTRLEALFSGRWENQLVRDEMGRPFLDINPKCFEEIVKYLSRLERAGPDNPPDLPAVDAEHEFAFNQQLAFFGLTEVLMPVLPDGPDSTIVGDTAHLAALRGWLEEAGQGTELELLYRASRDGFQASQFHNKCDNQGPTLTVVKCTGGYIFGGFADQPWCQSGGNYAQSSKAWLFALHCYSGLGPTKMPLTGSNNGHAMYHNSSYGPSFGANHDLYVCDSANTGNSYTHLGASYQCPAGQTAKTFLTGAYNFKAAEVEVFRVKIPESVPGATGSVWNQRRAGAAAADAEQEPWQTATFDGLTAELTEALTEEQQAVELATAELTELEKQFEKEQAFIDMFASGDTKDIVRITLNDGELSVKRSTLCLCEQSVLAATFNDEVWAQDSSAEACDDVSTWDVEKVVGWFTRLDDLPGGVPESARENEIDGNALLSLGREDLKDIGVKKIGHLKKVQAAIDELKSRSVAAARQTTLISADSYCFGKIVDQLRLRAMDSEMEEPLPAPRIKAGEERHFEELVQYYFPGDLSEFIIPQCALDSTIVGDTAHLAALRGWLEEAGQGTELELLYRASRDGFQASQFHNKCDNQGPTLTVVKCTGGYIFGGFADQPWCQSGNYAQSSKAWLFALHCYSGLGPTKMPLTGSNNGNAMYRNSSYGPTFGANHDLCVCDSANTGNSYTHLGASYQCPAGQTAKTFLTGAYNFKAAEVEVFRVKRGS